jgi:adenylate cyclase class 2
MLEIEMKFTVAEFAPIIAKLHEWKARGQPAIQEADHYFNSPDRDFGKTDEAFRLRSIGVENRVTYKGPKQGGPTKTRTEIEIGLESGAKAADQFRQLLQHLGYRPTAVVKKQRTAYDFERAGFALQACCDDVETLGRFVEIEIVTEPENKQRAQEVLLEVVRELNLPAPEPRAYITMVLEQQAKGTK